MRVASLRRPLDPAADQRAVTDLTRLMRRYQPHVVHTHMAKAGALGRSAARRIGTRAIVHTFHGHVLEGYFASPSNAASVLAERRLARAAVARAVLGFLEAPDPTAEAAIDPSGPAERYSPDRIGEAMAELYESALA